MLQKTFSIASHTITLMPPTREQTGAFGWITLRDARADVGFIYVEEAFSPADPHLGSDQSYVVTSMPMSSLATLLDILRNEANLQIRFVDPQVAGSSPSVFIEAAADGQPAADPLDTTSELGADRARRLALR